MIDERDLIGREIERFEPDPGFSERVMRRHARKRRNQRIRAGALGVAVALAVAIGVGQAVRNEPEPLDPPPPTPAVERVGFLGLPPEGAEPTPVRGHVLYYMETSAQGGEFDLEIIVYTGGQVIWVRDGDDTGIPEGATDKDTGYLLQVLSPAGVELLRDEILDTGLFERDLHLRGDYGGSFDGNVGTFHGPSGLWLDFEGGITVSWYGGKERFDGAPTPEQRDALARLVDRLADPASWLPETAWQTRDVQAFVASTYQVYICCRSRATAGLPAPANELLTEGEEYHCVTTDQARAIVEAYEDEGFPQTDPWFGGGITYTVGGEAHSFTPSFSRVCGS